MLEFVYVSDLHVDVASFNWDMLCVEGNLNKVLLIIGDTFTAGDRMMQYIGTYLEKVSSYYRKILVILGNHDYWGYGTLQDAIDDARNSCVLLSNVIILDHNTPYEIDGIAIFGDTLWVDVPPYAEIDFQMMDDFNPKHKHLKGILPEMNVAERIMEVNKWNEKARISLYNFLLDNADRKKLVFTHFPPVFQPTEREIGNLDLYYYNRNFDKYFYDEVIPDVYLYGHVHDKLNYEIASCRLRTNPRGYKGWQFGLKSIFV